MMEIEAKFALPDPETFRRLQAIESLAGFALSAGRAKQVRDTYLDTPDGRLLAAGVACRRREQGEEVLITLKGLRRAKGAVHRREELEVRLPVEQASASAAGEDPRTWPDGSVRDRVVELVGEASLQPLFTLQQARLVRQVSRDERLVGELSLDDVRVTAEGKEQAYSELEVELQAQGTEGDLDEIVACLQDEWGLEPEPRSKFQRAMTFLARAGPEKGLLGPRERAVCQLIATRDDLYGRRARALLALDEGATQERAGQRAGMSPRRVRHWLGEFRRTRLGIFPRRILDAAALAPTDQAEVPPEIAEVTAVAEAPPEPWAVETLFNTYGVDATHAIGVAVRALALFDHLLPFHGLSPDRRALLETAALVHDVGLQADPDQHHVAGRDILLRHPPEGLNAEERQIVAMMVFLHRKRISRKKLRALEDTAFAALPRSVQVEALTMAALLRMADGLDYSQTGTSRIGEVRRLDGAVEFTVTGPDAAVEAARAQQKSDLWHLLFDTAVRFSSPEMAALEDEALAVETVEAVEAPGEPEVLALPSGPGLEADDGMAEAARKTLAFHFQRMLFHEAGTRLGEDIEALHQMRVATRRMRFAFRVFGEYLDMKQMAPMIKGLQRTGRALGGVRDLDVFWEKTQRYLDALPPERQGDLDPLRAVWEQERERRRERMLAYLNSERFACFKESFAAFLETPGAGELPAVSDGEPRSYRLRHVLPVTVYQRLAAVRAYDEWVAGPDVPLERLHRLRIAAKGLRYTLEFFREVLGPEAEAAIKEIKRLQDHLGDLQDAVVASGLLRDFLTWGTWGHNEGRGGRVRLPSQPIIAPGVAAYLAARQSELQHLLDTFPQAWVRVRGAEFTHLVAASLATL